MSVTVGTLDGGKGLIRGDVTAIFRTVNDLPQASDGSQITIDKAWLMVKTAYSVLDASATISKAVTSTNIDGTGQIEDTGADGSGRLRFDLTNADTTVVTADTTYVYSIQVKLSNGWVQELETGTAVWRAEVVQATS